MSYRVLIQVGKGKNFTQTGSIPLPNKRRVCNYIKRSPLVKSNTKVKVTNLKNNELTIGTRYNFCSPFGKWMKND